MGRSLGSGLGVPSSRPDTSNRKPFDVTTLTPPDKSISVKFVSIGATMTELWVKDKLGNFRDILLGYDDNVSGVAS